MSSASTPSPLIEISGLKKVYGGTTVFENLDLNINTGELLAIVGPSGCGKSTLLRILLGQETADAGQVLLDGAPLPPDPSPERGVVFQRYSSMPHMTVLGNVMLGMELSGSPMLGRLFGKKARAAREHAMSWIEAVGLSHAAKRYPHELSGGMQQRLAIAQALCAEPRILLLDEPFGALDPGIRADMHALLFDLWDKQKITVLMVSHDLPEAFGLGTRVIVMDKPIAEQPAKITYDMPLKPKRTKAFKELLEENNDAP